MNDQFLCIALHTRLSEFLSVHVFFHGEKTSLFIRMLVFAHTSKAVRNSLKPEKFPDTNTAILDANSSRFLSGDFFVLAKSTRNTSGHILYLFQLNCSLRNQSVYSKTEIRQTPPSICTRSKPPVILYMYCTSCVSMELHADKS